MENNDSFEPSEKEPVEFLGLRNYADDDMPPFFYDEDEITDDYNLTAEEQANFDAWYSKQGDVTQSPTNTPTGNCPCTECDSERLSPDRAAADNEKPIDSSGGRCPLNDIIY